MLRKQPVHKYMSLAAPPPPPLFLRALAGSRTSYTGWLRNDQVEHMLFVTVQQLYLMLGISCFTRRRQSPAPSLV